MIEISGGLRVLFCLTLFAGVNAIGYAGWMLWRIRKIRLLLSLRGITEPAEVETMEQDEDFIFSDLPTDDSEILDWRKWARFDRDWAKLYLIAFAVLAVLSILCLCAKAISAAV